MVEAMIVEASDDLAHFMEQARGQITAAEMLCQRSGGRQALGDQRGLVAWAMANDASQHRPRHRQAGLVKPRRQTHFAKGATAFEPGPQVTGGR